jgi:transposase
MKSKRVEKQKRNHYSEEFKKQAVLRCDQEGVAAAASDLGLAANMLYAWRRKAKMSNLISDEQRLMQAENARLKREMARLEEENAFLKKAAAYFAKAPK